MREEHAPWLDGNPSTFPGFQNHRLATVSFILMTAVHFMDNSNPDGAMAEQAASDPDFGQHRSNCVHCLLVSACCSMRA